MGASLCRLCVSNSFGARADFSTDASHIFPQGMLAIIPLIGAVIGVVVSIVYAGCEVGPPLCSETVTILSGVGSAPQLLE